MSQEAYTAEWNRQADLYIVGAQFPFVHVNPDQEAELDFQIDDAGAWVTIRVWVSREEAGL